MLHLGLADERYKAIHIRLAMMQNMLRTYNASIQPVSSIKGQRSELIENQNTRKVT